MRRFALFAFVATGIVGCQPKPQPPVKAPFAASVPKPIQTESKKAEPPVDAMRLDGKVLAAAKGATVLIGNFEGGELRSTASGIVVGDGKTVLTNRHVVVGEDGKPDTLKLVFFPSTPNARIVTVPASAVTIPKRDKGQPTEYEDADDLAVVRIGAVVAKPLKTVPLSRISETEAVWALGFPNGLQIRRAQGDLPSPTVHALRVERIADEEAGAKAIQLGGSVTYGDSGGPVITREGHVVGVIQALADRRSSIIYALPATAFDSLIARAKGATPKADADAFVAAIPVSEAKPTPPEPRPRRRRIPHEVSSDGPTGEPPGYSSSPLCTRQLSSYELDGLSPRDLTILRNLPFARHGLIFRRPELRAAFGALPWYRPSSASQTTISRRLNRYERANVALIGDYQKKTGKTW